MGQEYSHEYPMNSPWIAMMIFGISIMGYHHLKRRLLDDSWREISHEYPRNRWPFQDPQELLAGDFPACHVWIARGYVSLKTSKNIHHFYSIFLVNPNHQEWYIYIYIHNIIHIQHFFELVPYESPWIHPKKWRGFLRCRRFFPGTGAPSVQVGLRSLWGGSGWGHGSHESVRWDLRGPAPRHLP